MIYIRCQTCDAREAMDVGKELIIMRILLNCSHFWGLRRKQEAYGTPTRLTTNIPYTPATVRISIDKDSIKVAT